MKKLLIIDANSFIHRAFHALPPLKSPQGEPTGALYGLTNTLIKVLEERRPDYAVAAFDTPEKTFRKEMFEEYKAQRPKAPDELKEQIEEAETLFKKMGVSVVKKPGFEADDVIGTLSEKFKEEGNLKIFILTGDLDTLQLVEDNKITVLTPKKGVSKMTEYNVEAVKERFGVKPKTLPDYKGLVGDSSDNIPGVRGVGPKTAAFFFEQWPKLEDIIKDLEKKKNPTSAEKKIISDKKNALMSKELATIKKEVPLEVKLNSLRFNSFYNKSDWLEYISRLGFESLMKRIRKPEKEENEPSLIFLSYEDCLNNIKNLNSNKIKVAFHWKGIIKELIKKRENIKSPLFDIKIATWLTNPDRKDLTPGSITKEILKEGLDEQKNKKEAFSKIFNALNSKLKKLELKKVFHNIEMPLIKVLAKMEIYGIGVDTEKLKELDRKIKRELEKNQKEIYKTAGISFNLNSPAQIGEVLFKKMGIKNVGKTSTGKFKTSEEALLEIKGGHPIIEMILNHRHLFKIKSTYIEPLIDFSKNGRIHTNFLQTGTATGRLSSENPNLQNIPKGGPWADKIRSCFPAKKGWSLASFDYSQLELRLLAHATQDRSLKESFNKNKDIHKITASKVLNKEESGITSSERRLAKTLNFGIIFGMGPRAFSKQSGLSLQEAKDFMDKYFQDFPEVKKWQEKIKREALSKGYITNLNNRRRWIKSNGSMDRAAINMPLQSLGADIIKKAMIETQSHLESKKLENSAKMVLSIHDELLLEIKDVILMDVIPEIKNIMEKNNFQLSVPLVVEVKSGNNWKDMAKK